MHYETKKRSILKAVSYRVLGTLSTALIVFILTGKIAVAATVGLFEVVSKMGLFFFTNVSGIRFILAKVRFPALSCG